MRARSLLLMVAVALPTWLAHDTVRAQALASADPRDGGDDLPGSSGHPVPTSTSTSNEGGAAAPLAGSIVYVRANDVWIASPDGRNQRRLTFSGTNSSPWRDPSIAGGTVFAFRNAAFLVGSRTNHRGTIFRMNQAGALLGSFRPPQLDSGDDGVSQGLGISQIAASPDGRRVAWQHTWLCPDPSNPPFDRLCYFTEVARADGSNSYTIGGRAAMSFMTGASWRGNATLLLSYRGNGISFYDVGANLGGAQPPDWFGYEDFSYQGDPDSSSGRLALVGSFDTPKGYVDAIELLTENGPPPSRPTSRCALVEPAGAFDDPSWSPGGGYLAWSESDSNGAAPEPAGEGIWVASIRFTSAGCTANYVNGRAAPVVADGESPEWGAVFDAAVRVGPGTERLAYVAGAPAANRISVTGPPARYVFTERADHRIVPGRGCRRVSGHAVSCSSSRTRLISVFLSDGSDRVTIGVARRTVLDGGRGNDTIEGGPAADEITGGAGRDVLRGGSGNDVVRTRDGERDTVSCGPGIDTVIADRLDVVSACEVVRR